jgi:hypothetical protein
MFKFKKYLDLQKYLDFEKNEKCSKLKCLVSKKLQFLKKFKF